MPPPLVGGQGPQSAEIPHWPPLHPPLCPPTPPAGKTRQSATPVAMTARPWPPAPHREPHHKGGGGPPVEGRAHPPPTASPRGGALPTWDVTAHAAAAAASTGDTTAAAAAAGCPQKRGCFHCHREQRRARRPHHALRQGRADGVGHSLPAPWRRRPRPQGPSRPPPSRRLSPPSAPPRSCTPKKAPPARRQCRGFLPRAHRSRRHHRRRPGLLAADGNERGRPAAAAAAAAPRDKERPRLQKSNRLQAAARRKNSQRRVPATGQARADKRKTVSFVAYRRRDGQAQDRTRGRSARCERTRSPHGRRRQRE